MSKASGPKLHRPSRGRPKDADKRAAILAASNQLFAAQGLGGTSMEAIAALAGVSKLTLYSHFQSKDELFRQTVFAKCSEYWPEVLFDVLARQPLAARLRRIGTGFLNLVNNDDVMSLYRLMAAQGGTGSKLGRLFWEAGPDRTMQRFAQVLQAAHAAGELAIPDARRAAAHFFVLLKGEEHLRCLVGAAAPCSAEERARHIDEVVELFLRAYAVPCG